MIQSLESLHPGGEIGLKAQDEFRQFGHVFLPVSIEGLGAYPAEQSEVYYGLLLDDG